MLTFERVLPGSGSGKAPTLVWLHGTGANEHDLAPLTDFLPPSFNHWFLRAPLASRLYPGGYEWFRLSESLRPDLATYRSSLPELRDALRMIADDARTDTDRLFLGGFSAGAIMSYGALTTRFVQGAASGAGISLGSETGSSAKGDAGRGTDRGTSVNIDRSDLSWRQTTQSDDSRVKDANGGTVRLAGVFLLSGGLIIGRDRASGIVIDEEDKQLESARVRGLPVFSAHGEKDPIIPVGLGDAMADELDKAGAVVTRHRYPIGHSVSEDEIEDLKRFLNGLV